MTTTTETATETDRYVGKCNTCKAKAAADLAPAFMPANVYGGRYAGQRIGSRSIPCPACPFGTVQLQVVIGEVSAKRCDGRCIAAIGPACSCQCGGANHGRKFLV